MPRFFIARDQRDGDRVRIDGAAGAHLARALRVHPGDHIAVVDEQQLEHTVMIDTVDGSAVAGRVVSTRDAGGEPALQVHVLQSLPQQGMDACIEGLVVAGAASVQPVLSARGVRRPGPPRSQERVQRWQAIAREAAQLAGRGRVPPVHGIAPLNDALDGLPAGCTILACVIGIDAVALAAHRPSAAGPVAVVIGPEGGLDPSEVDSLRARGATLVHLGERVAPARLAGVLALTLLLANSGDLASGAAVQRSHA